MVWGKKDGDVGNGPLGTASNKCLEDAVMNAVHSY